MTTRSTRSSPTARYSRPRERSWSQRQADRTWARGTTLAAIQSTGEHLFLRPAWFDGDLRRRNRQRIARATAWAMGLGLAFLLASTLVPDR